MPTCLQMSHLQHSETNNEIKVSLHIDQTNKSYAHNKIMAFLGNIQQDFSITTIKKHPIEHFTSAILQNKGMCQF